jgi:membrane associated rhomboid family serine protease
VLLAVTVALSLATAFGERHAGSLYDSVVLTPSHVWHGQVWRLLTWAVVEPSPVGLIFQCLFLCWFGRDLAGVWGGRRFVQVYGALAVGTGATLTLAARLDGALLHQAYVGGWPLTAALVVAWGLTFPDRVVRIYFILPIRGRLLAWLSVAFTVVYAIYEGWETVAPELVAELMMVAFVYRRKLWLHWEKARLTGELRRHTRRRSKTTKDVAYLRLVN